MFSKELIRKFSFAELILTTELSVSDESESIDFTVCVESRRKEDTYFKILVPAMR